MAALLGGIRKDDPPADTISLTIPKWDLPLFRVRPIRSTDRGALTDAYSRLSPASRYRRFFTPMNELPDGLLER